MKNVIKLEELAMWLACVYVFYLLQVNWWWYALILLGPDISMLGYLGGNKVGGILYNLFHHKGIAIAIIILSLVMENELILYIGITLFGHSSMDRVMGYGLKLKEGFKFTHLGEIGKKN